MSDQFGLKEKVALVTGASRGIGREICLELARSGTHIAVNYYPTAAMKQDAETVVKEVERLGGKAIACGADVTKPDQVGQMMAEISERFGGLDVLINNAGILRDRTLKKMTDEEWYNIIDVNLNAAYVCCKAALPYLRKGGSIVGMSSVAGVYGNFGQSNYAASKAGLIGFYKSLAKELGPKGIRVNAVAPGLVKTSMAELIPEAAQEQIREKTPLRRLAEPQDIARAVRFLVSQDASYITGHVLHVDGGLTF